MLRKAPVFLTLVLALAVPVPVGMLAAQDESSKNSQIWDGVYTTEQAERGKTRFTGLCRRCHNDDLGGSERGPALRGDRFMSKWETQGVDRLFAKIRDGMPPDSPSSLPDDDYIDLVARILQANSFPAGKQALNLEGLERILIVRKPGEGPREAPNFSLVKIVGCLSQGPDHAWMLTNAHEPVLTTDQPSTAATRKEADSQPLGPYTFRLVSASSFGLDVHKGHKMEAKGLVYRAPNKDRLNVISLEMVSANCGN